MGWQLEGQSNSSGFEIVDQKEGIRVATRDYWSPSVLEKIVVLIFIWVVFSPAVCVFAGIFIYLLGWNPFQNMFLYAYISAGTGVFLLAIVCCRVSKNWRRGDSITREEIEEFKRTRPKEWLANAQYHACEHKLIGLLENTGNGEELTVERLRKMSPVTMTCSCGEIQEMLLAEPSEEKLLEALEVGREYRRKLEEKRRK